MHRAIGVLALVIMALMGATRGALAEHYGITKQALLVGGRTLPAFSYVSIAYDGGDVWLTSKYDDAERLPKSAIVLIDRIRFSRPVDAVVAKSTPIYSATPSLEGDPSTLRQPLQHVVTPRRGDRLGVIMEEGDDYVVHFGVGLGNLGRLPASAVLFVPGVPGSGYARIMDPVPPIPSGGLVHRPVYTEPPTTPAPVQTEPPPTPLIVQTEPPSIPAPAYTEPPPTPPSSSLLSTRLMLPSALQDLNLTSILIILVPCSIALYLLVAFLRRSPAKKSSGYPTGFTSELKARFPSDRIYFVPKEAIARLKVPATLALSLFREDRPDWWTQLLQLYPYAPSDDSERENREEAFWQRYAKHFTATNGQSRPVLQPKQNIIDYFCREEKWIFREFYAATGVVHRTMVEEAVRHSEYRARVDSDATGEAIAHFLEKSIDETKQFETVTLPAHFEKWGGWFYFHVRESFDAQGTSGRVYGPQSATSPTGHPAEDELTYRPNS